jgi:hypothetical protein
MQTLINAVFLFACVLQFVFGIGVTLLMRRWFPRAAYGFGFVVPLIAPVLLWFVSASHPKLPCEPENSISCGEVDMYLSFIMSVIFLSAAGMSALIQFVLWQPFQGVAQFWKIFEI